MAKSSLHRAAVTSQRKDGTNPLDKLISSPRRELIAAASGAALLLVIGVLAAWAHHSLSTVRPVSPTIAAAPSADGLATPPTTPPMRVELRAWLTQAAPSIDALLTAHHEIASAAANDDIVGTGATCERAEGAVAGLQQYLPSPDSALNAALQQAIDGYHVGLRYCIAGAQHHDGDDLQQAATYIRQANSKLQAAVDLLKHDLPDSESPDARVLSV